MRNLNCVASQKPQRADAARKRRTRTPRVDAADRRDVALRRRPLIPTARRDRAHTLCINAAQAPRANAAMRHRAQTMPSSLQQRSCFKWRMFMGGGGFALRQRFTQSLQCSTSEAPRALSHHFGIIFASFWDNSESCFNCCCFFHIFMRFGFSGAW